MSSNKASVSKASNESQNRFDVAVRVVKNLNDSKLTNDEFGKLYGLYKQSLFGNCNIKEPPNKLLDLKGYKKWGCWKKYEGKSKNDAMNEYSDYVVELIDSHGLKK